MSFRALASTEKRAAASPDQSFSIDKDHDWVQQETDVTIEVLEGSSVLSAVGLRGSLDGHHDLSEFHKSKMDKQETKIMDTLLAEHSHQAIMNWILFQKPEVLF